ncbi:hypothetical protein [Mariniphaga sediminis]|uniref:hypothetical protein n=1 Tax=Mariniphaga sediminis TaxID=1628158 RepID=UPI0035624D00
MSWLKNLFHTKEFKAISLGVSFHYHNPARDELVVYNLEEKEHELVEVDLVDQVGNNYRATIYKLLPFESRKLTAMMFNGLNIPMAGNIQRIYLSNQWDEFTWTLGNDMKFTAELEII